MIILIASSTCGIDFDFESPESAHLNESIQIKIISDVSEQYDVKPFVENLDNETISKTLVSGVWKSGVYYAKSAWPQASEFTIKVEQGPSSAMLCVRMRKTGASSFTEKCKHLDLLEQSMEPMHNITLPEIKPDGQYVQQAITIIEPNVTPTSVTEMNKTIETIYLSVPEKTSFTRYSHIRSAIIYSLAIMMILLLVLFAFRKI